jgi:hypothetical protein
MDSSFDYYYEASPLATVIGLACAALMVIALWKIFVKAGEPGWAAIVPFYNMYTLFKITWGSGWKFLLMLIPIVNVVIIIMTYVKLAKAFGKGGGFAVGLIFLGVIFMCILGFGKAEYLGAPL